MSLDIIGAGFGRTGTLSLKLALEQLGAGPCYHMKEVFERPENHAHAAELSRAAAGDEIDWNALFANYRSMVDWPGAAFWNQLHTLWPEAKVLLSKRDGAAWHRSVMRTIWPTSQKLLQVEQEPIRSIGKMVSDVVWQGTFDGRADDPEYAIGVFDRHNAEVERIVPAEQLLIYEPGEGWARLCAFLDVPVPDAPFPHVNSSEDFPNQFGGKAT